MPFHGPLSDIPSLGLKYAPHEIFYPFSRSRDTLCPLPSLLEGSVRENAASYCIFCCASRPFTRKQCSRYSERMRDIIEDTGVSKGEKGNVLLGTIPQKSPFRAFLGRFLRLLLDFSKKAGITLINTIDE